MYLYKYLHIGLDKVGLERNHVKNKIRPSVYCLSILLSLSSLCLSQNSGCPAITNFNAQCSNDSPKCSRNVVLEQCAGPQTWQCCDGGGGPLVLCCGQELQDAGILEGTCPGGCEHSAMIFHSVGRTTRIELASVSSCAFNTRYEPLDTTGGRR